MNNKLVYGLVAGMVVCIILGGGMIYAALRPVAPLEEAPVEPTTEMAAEAAIEPPVEPTAVPPTAAPQPTEVPCAYDLYIIDYIFAGRVGPTELEPSEEFRVSWTLKNTGDCVWPAGTALKFARDHQMSGPPAIEIPGETPVDSEFEFTLELTAPNQPGEYQSTWQLETPEGEEIGGPIYFSIQVPVPPTATPVPPTETPIPPTTVPDAAAKTTEIGPTATPERAGPGDADKDPGFMDTQQMDPIYLLLGGILLVFAGLVCGGIALLIVLNERPLNAVCVAVEDAPDEAPMRACPNCEWLNSPRRLGIKKAACRNCGEEIDFTAPRADLPPPPTLEPPPRPAEAEVPTARKGLEVPLGDPDRDRAVICGKCPRKNFPVAGVAEAHQARCWNCEHVLDFPAAPAEEGATEEAPPPPLELEEPPEVPLRDVIPVLEEAIGESDDLKAIKGIGPDTARILNERGVWTFAQLAGADTRTVQRYFDDSRRSRVKEWQEQAVKLAAAQAAEAEKEPAEEAKLEVPPWLTELKASKAPSAEEDEEEPAEEAEKPPAEETVEDGPFEEEEGL